MNTAPSNGGKIDAAITCPRCDGTGKILFVSVVAGKMGGWRNCPCCNRNGQRKPKTCACGQPVETKHGKLCPACLFSARSMAGKSMKQAVRERKRKPPNVVAVLARCPATLHEWIAMLPPSQIEKGKLPRLYCPQHEKRRNLSESYVYGRVGG